MVKFNNTHNKVHIIDGKEVWESRSTAVNCVVIAKFEGELYVLIGQRGKGAPDSKGLWNLPAGYLDRDEDGTEACYREVWEETGLYLPEQTIVVNNLIQPWYVNTHPSENRQNIALRYGCVISCDNELPKLTNENSEPDEVDDLLWCNILDLDNYEFAFKHDIVIEKYLNLIGY